MIELDHEEKERQAAGDVQFTPSPFYEQLIEMRTAKSQEFEKFSMASRLALAYYQAAKQQADDAGREPA